MDREESFFAVNPIAEASLPPGGSDDEDSFVVLESSPSSISENITYNNSTNGEVFPPFRTHKVHEMQNLLKMKISQMNADSMPELPSAVDALDAVASSVAKITISPDSSYEEIQKQVEELIKENETLKNIIAQNNMSMKTQYDRFLAYRDEVTSVMKTYKEKFNEAKTCIDKFKEENATLADKVEGYMNLKEVHNEEILNLKEKVKKFENSHRADSTVEEKEETVKSQDILTELAESNLRITELITENEKLKSENIIVKGKIEDLLVASVQLQTKKEEINMLQFDNSVLKNREKELNDSISQLKTETINLKSKLSNVSKQTEKLAQSANTTAQYEHQLKLKNAEILNLQQNVLKAVTTEASLSEEITALKLKVEDLDLKLSNASKEAEKLAQSANTTSQYEQQLKCKEAEVIYLQTNLQKAASTEASQSLEIAALKVKLRDLQDKYNPNLEEDYNQVRRQLSVAQKMITALETEQEKKVKEIEELRKLIQESRVKCDEMFALKAQLTVYQNDFEAEKESNTSIKREKDQLAEDLQNVQKRNKQLQGEIERLRARDQPKAEGYQCPKCSFAFTTYQSLENHVHRCLDLDGFP